MRKLSRALVFQMTLAFFVLTGCGNQKNLLTSLSDKHYQKMQEQQQMKEAADEDAVPQEKIWENDPRVLEQMGDVYLKQGNIDMAFIQYDKALRIDPNRSGTRQKVGYLYLKKGLAKDALREFNAILIKEPRNTAALHGKASALIQLNRFPEAEEILKEEVSLDGKSWQAYVFLGTIYDRQRQYEDAVMVYRTAININPKSASAYNSLGVSLFLMGKYLDSADALLSAISIDPANVQSYNNLGLAFFKLGKYQEALDAFRKGGDPAGAYNNMGVLYMEEKRYAEAIESFEKAIEASPSYYENAYAGMQKAKARLNQNRGKPELSQPSWAYQ